MGYEMSLFSTTRLADRSPQHDARFAAKPGPLPTEQFEAAPALPRHLLVSLAGIIADVTSLQRICEDAPDLQTGLETMLTRLDGLVDSIYEAAANPNSARRQRPDLAAAFSSAAPSVLSQFRDASTTAKSPTPA